MTGTRCTCSGYYLSVRAAAFTIRPQDVVAMAGQMAMMRCEYTGVDVEWDREGTSIIATQEPCNCQRAEDGTLHFNNVSKEDEAKYTCVAQIGFMAARCSAFLWIAGKTMGRLGDVVVLYGRQSVCGYVKPPFRLGDQPALCNICSTPLSCLLSEVQPSSVAYAVGHMCIIEIVCIFKGWFCTLVHSFNIRDYCQ